MKDMGETNIRKKTPRLNFIGRLSGELSNEEKNEPNAEEDLALNTTPLMSSAKNMDSKVNKNSI